MRNLLIRGKTDRGAEFRQSTRKDDLGIWVYYRNENNEIKKIFVNFTVSASQKLAICVDCQKPVICEGAPAEQLSYK